MIKLFSKKRKIISLLLIGAMLAALIPGVALASSPDEVWVSRSFNSNTAGWNVTHFKTIQAGAAAAASNGIVNVAAGTYNENIAINKPLTLKGNNAGLTSGTAPATRKNESLLYGGIQINASNVVIDGFTISRGGTWGNETAGIYIVGGKNSQIISNNILTGPEITGNARGLLLGYYTSDVTIRNNEIRNWRSGIYINPSSSIIIEGNNISRNYVGIGSDGINNTSILRNNFYDNFLEGWGFSNVLMLNSEYLLAKNNNFVGNGYGVVNGAAIANYTDTIIDARSNWWGSTSGPGGGVIDPFSGVSASGSGDLVTSNVRFDPWLNKSMIYSKYSLSITGPSTAASGETAAFSIRTRSDKTGNTSYTAVYDYTVSGGSGTLQYLDGSVWRNISLSGQFGPSGGFELTPDYDVTTLFRFTRYSNNRYDIAITLRTTDGKNIATANHTLNAPERSYTGELRSDVKIMPKTMNLKSNGRWVKAIIPIPAANLNQSINSVVLRYDGRNVAADSYKVLNNGIHADFNWKDVSRILEETGTRSARLEIFVNGSYAGYEMISVISPGNPNPPGQLKR
jgi:parallel beta-helix repeat protein